MKKLWWLLLLAGCEQPPPEYSAASRSAAARISPKPAAPTKPATLYTSGDRETSGPLDTLHVGRGVVLRLVPGSKADFPTVPHLLPFSEASLIRQQGNGRVRRAGPTLVVRPFDAPTLRFSDNTYQMRNDQNEEADSQCRFLGSIPGRPYWLADSALWERSQPFLINKQSGRITPLDWEPEISPNRQRLLTASPGLDSPASDNTIQLLAINDQQVTLLWTRALAHWQPQQVRWLNNHTIAIEQFRFEPKPDTTYVRLLLPK